jgi:nucleotide-binding universal stress UspA family protein
MDIAPDTVVVGLDRSPDSWHALDWAVAAAAAAGAPLHIVHALEPPVLELPPTAAEQGALRELAREFLSTACQQARAGGIAHPSSEFVEASASSALLEAGRRAALLVVGAQGHGALYQLFLGSVSQHLSRHAECSVVVVRPPADPDQRRIVVGVDGSPPSDRALRFAFEIAAPTAAPVVAAYGWRDHSPATVGTGSPLWVGTAERVHAGEQLLQGALSKWREAYPSVPLSAEAIPVHPTRMLVDASEHAALVVVGARGAGGFAGLHLGSVPQGVLHHARCPVAITR